MDWLIVITLAVSFGALVTSHLTLCVGLARREGLWRGALALLLPPLALVWGLTHRLRVRSAIWLTSAVLYVVALIAASSGA
ncbi:MAG: hypothetical protein KC766_22710 [Myxococcales bacterium]|nr:hypothetical protein [Myxococcales bacterium]